RRRAEPRGRAPVLLRGGGRDGPPARGATFGSRFRSGAWQASRQGRVTRSLAGGVLEGAPTSIAGRRPDRGFGRRGLRPCRRRLRFRPLPGRRLVGSPAAWLAPSPRRPRAGDQVEGFARAAGGAPPPA